MKGTKNLSLLDPNMAVSAHSFLSDLEYAFHIYESNNMHCSAPVAEPESVEYAACQFILNNLSVLYREAKITPTKTGLFVTLWKRSAQGPIRPYELTDHFDFVVICTRNQNQFGQFVFPKAILVSKGIVSTATKEGKRGFRVYPPWSNTSNKQAQQTQQWQSDFFIGLTADTSINQNQLHSLFNQLPGE